MLICVPKKRKGQPAFRLSLSKVRDMKLLEFESKAVSPKPLLLRTLPHIGGNERYAFIVDNQRGAYLWAHLRFRFLAIYTNGGQHANAYGNIC